MGYYIQVENHHNKARQLEIAYGAIILDRKPTLEEFRSMPASAALIVVVDNGPFEAAGFAFDESEFLAFTQPTDARMKQYLVMPRQVVEKLTGFKEREDS